MTIFSTLASSDDDENSGILLNLFIPDFDLHLIFRIVLLPNHANTRLMRIKEHEIVDQ